MPDSTPWFDFQLSGLADGWNYESTCRRDAEEVCVVQFRFRREQAGPLPELRLEFELPWLDMQLKWQPRRNASDCHHFFPCWWDGGKIPYGITHNQPLWVFANEAGENRLALACSECRRIVLAGCGVAEKTIQCRLLFHTTPCDPAAEFSFELRIDRRALPYDTVLRDLAAWQAERYPAAPVPASALLPVYSTWYQYQKGVS